MVITTGPVLIEMMCDINDFLPERIRILLIDKIAYLFTKP